MKYKNIVFDVDGTLLDSEDAVLLSLQETIMELQNKTVNTEDLRFALGRPGKYSLDRLGIENAQSALEIWDRNFLKRSAAIKLFGGIAEVLLGLNEKPVSLGIITSKTRKEYANDLLRFGIDKYFSVIICAEDSVKHKPDPEPMIQYLLRSGANPKETLYVGDTIYDMQCAGSAGVDYALALWGCKTPQNIEAAHYFEYPEDIYKII